MRQPPMNYEAEQALLAALLAIKGVFGLIAGMVTAEDFADPVHGRDFTAACNLIQRGEIASA
jgi:replicative DNA helicase